MPVEIEDFGVKMKRRGALRGVYGFGRGRQEAGGIILLCTEEEMDRGWEY